MATVQTQASEPGARSKSARELLLETAERLIGERGIEVSLREIAAEAGQRNNSAVHYYFGTRDALVAAVVEFRQQPSEQERLTLLANLDMEGRTDLRSLVEALVTPMFHKPYNAGATHYARFLEKVRDHPALSSAALEDHQWPATKMLVRRMAKVMDDLPPKLVEIRLRAMMTAMFALLADEERRLEAKERRPVASDAEPVVDMLVGMLTASRRG